MSKNTGIIVIAVLGVAALAITGYSLWPRKEAPFVGEPTLHIVCEKCGATEDLTRAAIAPLLKGRAGNPIGVEVPCKKCGAQAKVTGENK